MAAEHRKLWSTEEIDEDSPMETNDDEAMSESEELNSNRDDVDSMNSQDTQNRVSDCHIVDIFIYLVINA